MESKVLQEACVDETNFKYELAELYCSVGKVHRQLTWKTTPESVKKMMKLHVSSYILPNYNLDAVNELSVPSYCYYIRKNVTGKPDISVNFKWAILEVLCDLNVRRKFTLHYNGRYWIISFIYDYTSLPDSNENTLPSLYSKMLSKTFTDEDKAKLKEREPELYSKFEKYNFDYQAYTEAKYLVSSLS